MTIKRMLPGVFLVWLLSFSAVFATENEPADCPQGNVCVTATKDTWLAAFSMALVKQAMLIDNSEPQEFHSKNLSPENNKETLVSRTAGSVTLGSIKIEFLNKLYAILGDDGDVMRESEMIYDIFMDDNACGVLIKGYEKQVSTNGVNRTQGDLQLSTSNCALADLLEVLEKEGVMILAQSVGINNLFTVSLRRTLAK